MKVSIKDFNVQMEIKNKDIELDVSDTKGVHLGDLVITKTKVTWCPGRTSPNSAGAKNLSWEKFIGMMDGL